MAIINTIERDTEAELNGLRVPFDAVPGITFIVARMWNPRFIKRRAELIGNLAGAWDAGDCPQDKKDEINDRAFAETVLVGWEGVELEGENGEAVATPYSHAQSYEFLHSPRWITVRNFVLYHAQRADAYLASARKKALLDLPGSSSGIATTETKSSSSEAA